MIVVSAHACSTLWLFEHVIPGYELIRLAGRRLTLLR